MLDLPFIAPTVVTPDPKCLTIPVSVEAWHHSGFQISFNLGDVIFEQFRSKDINALYEIRNHSTVRPFMPSADALPIDQHIKWVKSNVLSITSLTPLILVGRIEGQPVGFGVIKPTSESGTIEIGVIVCGVWQRSALPVRLGAALLAIAAQIFAAQTLLSTVSHQHDTALRLNRGVGFILSDSFLKPGEAFFRTPTIVAISTPIYKRCIRGLTLNIDAGRNFKV
jgi:hypothetical protein